MEEEEEEGDEEEEDNEYSVVGVLFVEWLQSVGGGTRNFLGADKACRVEQK